ncbi:MAG: condensation domain-containing protein, partial [Ktedonobacteraceae bacterium]
MDTSLHRKRDVASKKMELLKLLLKKEGIEGTHEGTVLTQPALQVVSRVQPLPLSFAQQRLWFLEQLDPGSVAYTIPMVLRLRGLLDLPALQTSLLALIQRHDVLRTTFGSHEGLPVQLIIADPLLAFSLLDLAHLPPEERHIQERAWLAAELATPFDLERGPLLRVRLLCCGEKEHVLLLLFHHIIFDGWSVEVLLRELTTLYL